jgi:TRAP-type C4-dicarboxylate transport system substrate-binding protein
MTMLHRVSVVAVAILLLNGALDAQGEIRIRLGAVVPSGSLWDESLQYLRHEWRRLTGGAVQVTVYSGGVLGDEPEMVRQIRLPLSQTDMVTSLQTGMIEAFSTVPLFAQLQESYKLAPHMIDVLWMPLVGGTVICRSVLPYTAILLIVVLVITFVPGSACGSSASAKELVVCNPQKAIRY